MLQACKSANASRYVPCLSNPALICGDSDFLIVLIDRYTASAIPLQKAWMLGVIE